VPIYEVGQTLVFGLRTTNAAGDPADLGGGPPTATITKPDAATALASIAQPATGTYTASITGTQLGRYRCAWTGTGTNAGGLPYADHADVLDMSRLIVPLADARAALNVPAGSLVNDDELRLHIAAATLVAEHIAGPVLAATRTERRSGGNRYSIALFEHPTAVTSVTVDGTAVTDWCVDEAGVLWRGSRPGFGVWPNGAGNVIVTYTVGGATVPPSTILAATKLIRHWWNQGQQSYYVDGPPDDGATVYVAGYAVPNAVVDLLAPTGNRMPGLA
jgi:hypothetical protein